LGASSRLVKGSRPERLLNPSLDRQGGLNVPTKRETPTGKIAAKEVVAGYGRVSTVRQALEGTSAEDQRQRIVNYCKQHDFVLHEFYADEGISGKNMEHRPAIQKLIADAKDGKFSAVLFTKIDRIGRNLREVLDFYHLINEEYHLELISIDQPEINTKGSIGKALLQLIGTFAEFERTMIRERMSGGRLIKWKRGESVVGAMPYGYAWNGKAAVPHGEQAAVVRQIFSLYLDQHLTTKQIAIQLSEEGTPTPSKAIVAASTTRAKAKGTARDPKRWKGSSKWNNTTVGEILKREAYSGATMTFNRFKRETRFSPRTKRPYVMVTAEEKPSDQWIEVSFPPLIGVDRWEAAQRRLDNQRHRPKKKHKGYEEHFMADNVLYCGECGGRMHKRLKQEKNGRVRYYYTCFWKRCDQKELVLAGRERCNLDSVDAECVDRDIWSYVVTALTKPIQFAEQWFGDPDMAQLRSRAEQLRAEEQAAEAKMKAGLAHLSSVENITLQQTYRAELKRYEADYLGAKQLRERVEFELAAKENKLELVAQFKREIEKGAKAGGAMGIWGNKAWKKSRTAIPEFLAALPFAERKRILEAVVSPENDGKVLIRFQRPTDYLDEVEIRRLNPELLHQPQMDRPKFVDCRFFLDPERIKAIVSGLNKTTLSSKLDSSGTAGGWYRTGRRWGIRRSGRLRRRRPGGGSLFMAPENRLDRHLDSDACQQRPRERPGFHRRKLPRARIVDQRRIPADCRL
jgi:site-specific DNA recombinase